MRLTHIREGDDIMTETLPIIHVISDSWMHEHYLVTERIDLEAFIKNINIAPHRVALSIRPAERVLGAYGLVQECQYKQFVKSSLTFERAAAKILIC